MIYRQCELVNGDRSCVTWLPDGYAERGRVLKLKDDSGNWSDGWIVASVGLFRMKENELPDIRKGIRNHRKRTGDSLIKR